MNWDVVYIIVQYLLLICSSAVFLYVLKKLHIMNYFLKNMGFLYANMVLIFLLAFTNIYVSIKSLIVSTPPEAWAFASIGRLSQLVLYVCILRCIKICGVDCGYIVKKKNKA